MSLKLEKIIILLIPDDSADLSYLESTYDEENNTIDSCRYSAEDIKKYGLEKVQQWIKEDNARLNAYGDRWYFIGIRARAEIRINGIYETIESPGLWGIDSDSDQKYFEDIGREECNTLKSMLQEIGFTALDIDNAPVKFDGDPECTAVKMSEFMMVA
jgi:hypothetical protein